MLPGPNDLEFFMEVVSTGNMSRAAERLGVSQPALSQAVKRLEANIGQQLLLRSKTGVKATKVGERLAQKSKDLLSQWEELKFEASREKDEIRGRFKVGVHPSVAIYSLGDVSSKIIKKYPHLELKFQHDLSRKVTEQVISMEVDMALAINPVAHPDLVMKEICLDTVSFYQAKNCNSDVLIYHPDLGQSQEMLSSLKKKELNYLRTITSDNLEFILELTINGCGVSILPGKVAQKAGKKIMAIDSLPTYKDKLYLIYRHDWARNGSTKKLASEFYNLIFEKFS
ncbi:LysR family transcriptional regulator [Bacteriovoracaceae bacterium]|nr:LysR family transcriptional regulator [Bacteriovoracaceae bacterium]|tara:strand:+ start:223802 stop:224653 length:852 start_codon:yes stop_codon:yes gene_type:complete